MPATIERFEPCPAGVRLAYAKGDAQDHIDAAVAVVAVGWVANTAGLNLAAAGVETDQRGYVQVDSELRTTAPHIFAAGDITGHVMVVHEAGREAYLAATNAVLGHTAHLTADVSPLGSFTDPEYASVGAHRGDSAQHPRRRRRDRTRSTRCPDRSSTAARPASAS